MINPSSILEVNKQNLVHNYKSFVRITNAKVAATIKANAYGIGAIEVFKIFNNDKENKVIILEGAGKGFSAGHNLKELKNLKVKKKYNQIFNACSELMMLIVNNNKPVIAKVHGAAFAAGCQLVASCDLALSSKEAVFATPGVNIGLFCSTPMVALSRKVNRKRSMKMLLIGEYIDAKYAKEKTSNC